MRKAIVLGVMLVAFSVAACNTTPTGNDTVMQGTEDGTSSVKDAGDLISGEDSKEKAEVTELPVPTSTLPPEPSATPEPTPTPASKIRPDDTAFTLLDDTLGNEAYLRKKCCQTNTVIQGSDKSEESIYNYTYDSYGKVRRSVRVEDKKARQTISTSEIWIEPAGDAYTCYECSPEGVYSVTSVDENPIDFVAWLKEAEYGGIEYRESISEISALISTTTTTAKDIEERFGYTFDELVAFVGGDRSLIADLPVYIQYYFDSNRDLKEISFGVSLFGIDNPVFNDLTKFTYIIHINDQNENFSMEIPYQLFEEDNYGDLSRYPVREDLKIDYRAALDATLGNEAWRTSGQVKITYEYSDIDGYSKLIKDCAVNDTVVKVAETFSAEVYYEDTVESTSEYLAEKRDDSYVLYEVTGENPQTFSEDVIGVFDILSKSKYFKPAYTVSDGSSETTLKYFSNVKEVKEYYNIDLERMFNSINTTSFKLEEKSEVQVFIYIDNETAKPSSLWFNVSVPAYAEDVVKKPQFCVRINFNNMGETVDVMLP